MGARLGEPVCLTTKSCVEKHALATLGDPGTRETGLSPEGGDGQGEEAKNIVVVLPCVQEKGSEDALIHGGVGPRSSCGLLCTLLVFRLELVINLSPWHYMRFSELLNELCFLLLDLVDPFEVGHEQLRTNRTPRLFDELDGHQPLSAPGVEQQGLFLEGVCSCLAVPVLYDVSGLASGIPVISIGELLEKYTAEDVEGGFEIVEVVVCGRFACSQFGQESEDDARLKEARTLGR